MTTPANTVRRGSARGYQVGDDWYIGVTSLIRATLADGPTLTRWKQKRLVQLAIEHREAAVDDALDRDALIADVLRAQYESGPEAVLGTRVHSLIDTYERSGDETIEDVSLLAYLKQWLTLKEEHALQVRWTERTLVNTQLGYAGTADGGLNTTLNGQRDQYIYDLKTGKGVYDSYALQLALLSRCDAWLTADGELRSLDGDGWNQDYAIVAKLGPRSRHLHAIDLHAAWEYAQHLPALYRWQEGAGAATIGESITPAPAVTDPVAKREELLHRARHLDAEVARTVKARWNAEWPALTDAAAWNGELLDDVDQLIAWAERGGLA
jgi:hypothetical protein